MPLEAALCGCRLVLSDSGGVRDFALNFGAEMVTICPDPAKTFTVLEKACAKKGVNKPKLSTNFGDAKSWCEFITKNIQEVNFPAEEVTFARKFKHKNEISCNKLVLEKIYHSKSWRITKPLRRINLIINKPFKTR